jgi:hypothetical protein
VWLSAGQGQGRRLGGQGSSIVHCGGVLARAIQAKARQKVHKPRSCSAGSPSQHEVDLPRRDPPPLTIHDHHPPPHAGQAEVGVAAGRARPRAQAGGSRRPALGGGARQPLRHFVRGDGHQRHGVLRGRGAQKRSSTFDAKGGRRPEGPSRLSHAHRKQPSKERRHRASSCPLPSGPSPAPPGSASSPPRVCCWGAGGAASAPAPPPTAGAARRGPPPAGATPPAQNGGGQVAGWAQRWVRGRARQAGGDSGWVGGTAAPRQEPFAYLPARPPPPPHPHPPHPPGSRQPERWLAPSCPRPSRPPAGSARRGPAQSAPLHAGRAAGRAAEAPACARRRHKPRRGAAAVATCPCAAREQRCIPDAVQGTTALWAHIARLAQPRAPGRVLHACRPPHLADASVGCGTMPPAVSRLMPGGREPNLDRRSLSHSYRLSGNDTGGGCEGAEGGCCPWAAIVASECAGPLPPASAAASALPRGGASCPAGPCAITGSAPASAHGWRGAAVALDAESAAAPESASVCAWSGAGAGSAARRSTPAACSTAATPPQKRTASWAPGMGATSTAPRWRSNVMLSSGDSFRSGGNSR